jgi:SET domain-containing protein
VHPSDPPSELWVDERVAVGPSAIEGRGLVAAAPIAAGTTVIRLAGRLVSSAELEALIAAAERDPSRPYVDTITVDEDRHLVFSPGTTAHFANHSCDPNLWIAGRYEIVVRRHVRAGDELTIDYGTISGVPGFSMACRCGSTVCRGAVTSDDWRDRELQVRYRDHWVPALQARIDGV